MLPLQQFDLLAHGQDCQRPFWCMMAFGITFEDENSINGFSISFVTNSIPLGFVSMKANSKTLTKWTMPHRHSRREAHFRRSIATCMNRE
jgi:hypothetical protein